MKRTAILLLLLTSCGSESLSFPIKSSDSASTLSAEAPTTGAESPSNRWLKIIIMDVGQGAASLLIAPDGETALFDTGPEEIGEKRIAEIIADQKIEKLDRIFITHHHLDHEGSLRVIQGESLGQASVMVDNRTAKIGETISLGGVTINTFAANGTVGDQIVLKKEDLLDENAASLALVIEYGKFRLLNSGDLPGGGGEPPYDTADLETPLAPLVGDVDIFLVPHHGSHTSSNEAFLSTIKPEVGIISVGDKNDYFHPHPSLIQRLKNHKIEIWQTEQGWLKNRDGVQIAGSICILSNGKQYSVKPYAVDKCQAPP